MKKALLFLGFLPCLAFGQFVPDDIAPTGWIQPFNELEIGGQSVFVDGDNTFDSDGDAVSVVVDAASTFEGVKFPPYAIGNPTDKNFVDITADPVVYIKLKGTIGDLLRVDLKNTSEFAFVDGYSLSQEVTCTGFSWYKFDFSGVLDKNDDDLTAISEVVIAYRDGGPGAFTVDSILLGSTGITPELPSPKSDVAWESTTSSPFWTYISPEDDGSLESVDGAIVATFDEGSADDAVLGFNVNHNGNETAIDLTSNPIIKISIKGNDGDTIRMNLKGPAFEFIDGFNTAFILDGGSEFKEYTVDFTGFLGIDAVNLIEIDVNPIVGFVGTIEVNSILAGDVEYQACSYNTAVGIWEGREALPFDIFPNPVSDVATVTFDSKEAGQIQITNLLGMVEYSAEIEAGSNEVQIMTSELTSGMHVITITSGDRVASRQIQVQ